MYRKKTTYFLIGSVIIFLLIILFRPQPKDSQTSYDKLFADKTHTSKKFNIMLVGDSRIYRGLSPAIIEDKLPGNDVLNFGYSSLGFNSYIFDRIEEKIDSTGDRPVILVLGLTPHTFTPNGANNWHHYQEFTRPKKEVYQIRYINPLFSVFDPIKPDQFIGPKSGQRKSGSFAFYNYRGWVASDVIPSDTSAAIASYKKVFNNNRVDPSLEKTFLRKVKSWTNRGWFVIGFRVPTTIEMVKLENDSSGYKEPALVSDFEWAGGIYLHFRNKDYQTYDGSHLRYTSAEKLSADLADSLKRYVFSVKKASKK